MALTPPAAGRRHSILSTLLTLAVGAAGALLFWLASAPAAFLTGSAFAVTLAALAKLPLALPPSVRHAGFSILGATMASGVTPQGLSDLASLPVGILGLCLVLAGATASSYFVLRRMGRFRPIDAFLGSVPGHFSLVMALTIERGARVEHVIVPQVLRLFVLIVLIPFLFGGAESATLRVTAPADLHLSDVMLTVGIAAASSLVAFALKVPAGTLMGPLVVCAILSGTGLVTIAVPVWLAAAAFVILGSNIGERFRTVRRDGLKRLLAASLASFVAAFAVAIVVSVAVAAILEVPLGAVLIGYSPGGLDAMIALSFLLGYDVAFVALLHMARMLILGVSTPLLASTFRPREKGAEERGRRAG